MTKGYINITDVKEFHKQIMNPQNGKDEIYEEI